MRQSSNSSASADASACEPLEVVVLTRRMAEGDEMAYRIFYAAYFDRLCRYLLVVTAGNEDAVREALQATLVRVTRHIKIFQNEETFWSWLTVLARSAISDETRKRRRYFSFLERFTRHAAIASDGASGNQTDKRLGILLEHQIALLPSDEQKLVEQKYYQRRAVREIAGELQTTEKAVESKLSRVRRKLKDAVLAELNHEPRT
ncbi:MAG: sigma-70 family RNA polymerase sigma factor [Verrucomicrobiota bacterium]